MPQHITSGDVINIKTQWYRHATSFIIAAPGWDFLLLFPHMPRRLHLVHSIILHLTSTNSHLCEEQPNHTHTTAYKNIRKLYYQFMKSMYMSSRTSRASLLRLFLNVTVKILPPWCFTCTDVPTPLPYTISKTWKLSSFRTDPYSVVILTLAIRNLMSQKVVLKMLITIKRIE